MTGSAAGGHVSWLWERAHKSTTEILYYPLYFSDSAGKG